MNVSKLVDIFGIHDKSFIDFNKWKQDNIPKVVLSNYLESNITKRKSIMNELITNMNLLNKCKAFRVLDNTFSVVMSEKEIRKSIGLLFRIQVSYVNINSLKPVFWKNVYKS